jgi:hypothetical protein
MNSDGRTNPSLGMAPAHERFHLVITTKDSRFSALRDAVARCASTDSINRRPNASVATPPTANTYVFARGPEGNLKWPQVETLGGRGEYRRQHDIGTAHW